MPLLIPIFFIVFMVSLVIYGPDVMDRIMLSSSKPKSRSITSEFKLQENIAGLEHEVFPDYIESGVIKHGISCYECHEKLLADARIKADEIKAKMIALEEKRLRAIQPVLLGTVCKHNVIHAKLYERCPKCEAKILDKVDNNKLEIVQPSMFLEVSQYAKPIPIYYGDKDYDYCEHSQNYTHWSPTTDPRRPSKRC